MADADALRYLRIAQADLLEARRMLELSGFRDSSIGFLLQQACEQGFKSRIHSRGGYGSLHPRSRGADGLAQPGRS